MLHSEEETWWEFCYAAQIMPSNLRDSWKMERGPAESPQAEQQGGLWFDGRLRVRVGKSVSGVSDGRRVRLNRIMSQPDAFDRCQCTGRASQFVLFLRQNIEKVKYRRTEGVCHRN